MRGHLGAVLTSGLAAVALALAALQAVVVISHGGRGSQVRAVSAARGESNRFSAPGGRSGIPYLPFEKASTPPEGRTPERQQEEHRTPPPPSRFRSTPPRIGPQPTRKVAA